MFCTVSEAEAEKDNANSVVLPANVIIMSTQYAHEEREEQSRYGNLTKDVNPMTATA